ncbi:mannitol dehydrogenase family protein [Erwinia pyri]|uniref:Mannitol dehydrogenase family protein n=1 Tax=Erwinia pyri TaxID=3062598 RepID=A0AA50DNJ7_9GAMM|nr:D-arabinitol 4-dehydrogenase [Erwinia sp. DE2]WLS79351.1 mannitol dehydrogenase family protein [Erwinia sp. DE2]
MAAQQTLQWVHIGAGSFHRAHQACYLNRLLQQGGDSAVEWHIALGNIRDDAETLLSILERQKGEYVLETVSPAGEREYEKITVIKKIIPWDIKLAALIAEGAAPETKVISFTVTEGGYYLDSHRVLDKSNRDVDLDLKGGVRTIYGAIAHILQRRMEQQAGPITLMCCDNVRQNGEHFRDGLVQFLTLRQQDGLLKWLAESVTTPNTMVDRITPRPSPDIAARVKTALGISDAAPVMAESFIQWVVEDKFAAERPALEKVDVALVNNVEAYEEAKTRILNASHSAIAWAGTLQGLSFIDESTHVKAIYQLAWDYVTEDVIPCLTPSPLDLESYRDVILERFGNPYIKDTNQRVAADGLSKIPGFITPTLITRYEQGETPRACAKLPALFFLFMRRWHEGSLPYNYEDGILDPHQVHAWYQSEDPVKAFASDNALFSTLAGKANFIQLIRESVECLEKAALTSTHQ